MSIDSSVANKKYLLPKPKLSNGPMLIDSSVASKRYVLQIAKFSNGPSDSWKTRDNKTKRILTKLER